MKIINQDWPQLISDLETETREGRSELVVEKLTKLRIAKIPRKFRHQIAELARRNSAPMLALRVMNSIVRGKGSELQKPSDLEKIAYANSLTALGCNRESVELLKTVSAKDQPKVNLFMTFAYVGLWEYQKTIPLLRSFIARPDISNYEVLVGQVNLLAAFVDTARWTDFESTFQQVVHACEAGGYHLLLGNTFELKGQSLIAQKRYEESLVYLERAEQLLKEVGGVYYLFVKKWQLIAKMLLGRLKHGEALEQSAVLKMQASKFNVWEVFRDLDLYLSIAFQDSKFLASVLDSTPMKNFRLRAEKIAEKKIEFSSEKYFCFIQSDLKQKPQSLNLSLQDLKSICESKLLWKCFLILLQDGFKPVSLGRMYSELFPETYFDPYSAEKRVHGIISRLRKCFVESKLPMSIQNKNNEFYLSTDGEYENLVLQRESLKELPRLREFKDKVRGKSFKAEEAKEILEVSRDEMQMLIKEWIQKKKVKKLGNGPGTRYMFWNRSKTKAS